MFKKILVANRGEIAIRAFRAAYELGAATVAVFPYEDRNSSHRLKADEAYQIGTEGHPVRAYLDVAEIIRVAKESGADAIYPGYGFLSENPDLAEAAAANGITFIGPKADVLELAGNKVNAKEAAIAAGVPVLASSPSSSDVTELLAQGDAIGFPLFVKAVAGGGGRGMRRVNEASGLAAALAEAMREADVLAFVVDAQVGALDEDDILVSELRKAKKPTILIANKVDDEGAESDAYALWNLGLGEPYFVSALHGRGSGDLLDHIVAELPEVGRAQVQDGYRRVALIGRPNVGKSSLLNALAGETRSIVDDVAGTTRDPVDELIEIGDQVWRFIDTAGLRKRANQASGTDYYATLRTQTALERCEVAAVVLDASNPISEQDLRIITMVEEAGKAMVIVMNKWDLVDEDRRDQLDKEIDRHLDQVEWAQRVNVAAKTGWHRDRLAPALRTALGGWEQRVPTAKLNSFLGALIGATPPPVRGGKQPKIYYATQAGIAPPKFVIFSSGWIEASYRRFIERRLREEFGFPGTPVMVAIRVKERDKE